MSKISIELGGKYTAGEMFKRAQEDAKKFGAETRDMSGAATKALDTISGKLGNEVSPAIRGASDVLKGFAQGGLWGLLGSAATLAIGAIVTYFNNAKEAAKNFSEYVATSTVGAIDKLAQRFGDTKKQIDTTRKSAEDALKVLEGKKAEELQNKIYQIHTETLQKITDDMSEKGRAVVLAEEKIAVAEARAAAWHETQMARRELLAQETEAAQARVAAAQTASAAAQERVNSLHEGLAEILQQKNLLELQAEDILKKKNEGEYSATYAQEALTATRNRLAEIEESSGQAIKSYNDAVAKSTSLKNELALAEENYKTVRNNEETTIASLNVQTRQLEQTIIDAKVSYNNVAKTNQDEVDALARKKEEEALSFEEKKKRELYEARMFNHWKVTAEEFNQLKQKLNEAIEDGLEDAELEAVLTAEYRRLLEERNSRIEKDEQDQKSGKAKAP